MLGLISAINWQLNEFQSRTEINCKLQNSLKNLELNQDKSTAIFRIFQESLTNIARHSSATDVNVKINRKNGMINLEVSDNGRGIDNKRLSNTKSLGLLGMKERAVKHGGELLIDSKKGKGTKIVLRMRTEKND